MKKIKVALVGHGYLGQWHARKALAHAQAELVCIVETNEGAHGPLSLDYPQVLITSDLREALPLAEAFLVAVPTSVHFGVLRTLMESGKHIFCEKPLASNSHESQELLERSQGREEVFQVGHSERFHGLWEFRSEFDRFLRPPFSLRLERLAPFKGRAQDVDVARDLMIHDLDILYHLLGRLPQRLKATGHKVKTGHWDHVMAQLSFGDLGEACLVSGRCYVKEVRTLEMINECGTLVADMYHHEVRMADVQRSGGEGAWDVVCSPCPRRDHLLEEQNLFYQAILEKRPPPVSLEEGALMVGLVEKVLESLEKRDEVVLDEKQLLDCCR